MQIFKIYIILHRFSAYCNLALTYTKNKTRETKNVELNSLKGPTLSTKT